MDKSEQFQRNSILIGSGIFMMVTVLFVFIVDVFFFDRSPVMTIHAENRFETEIIVAADIDYEPFSFLTENGEPIGYDVELLYAIANEMQINVRIMLMPWSECIEAVRSGKADLIMGIDYQPNTYPDLSFSTATQNDPFVCFGKTKIRNISDLYGKRLAVVEYGGSVFDFLEAYNLSLNAKIYQSYSDVMKSVSSGETDYAIMRYPVGKRILSRFSITDISVTGPALIENVICIAGKKENISLMNDINAAIAVLRENKTMQILSDKWVGNYIKITGLKDIVKVYWYIMLAAGCAVLVFLVMLILCLYRKKTDLVYKENQSMRRVQKYQKLLIDATHGLYENVYEWDITHNCAGSKQTERYFESLGMPGDISYDQGIRGIATLQIKEEFIQGYLDLFFSKNILKSFREGTTNLYYDFQITHDGKNFHWIRISAHIFYWKEDNSVRMITFRENIDREKKREEELLHEAKSDLLTGLYNKKAAESLISTLISLNAEKIIPAALIILDIDHFKHVNDTLGHIAGDLLIRETAKKIESHFRKDDIFGRFGGDEFIIFLEKIPSLEWLCEKLADLNTILYEELPGLPPDCAISASIGAALFPNAGSAYEDLFEKADKALYMTKNGGRNGYTVFTAQDVTVSSRK